MGAQRARFGGLGALFFLASLGGIAFYVQSQTIPDERDLLRKPATALPEVEDESAAAPVMAWEDRVDFSKVELVPFRAPIQPATATVAGPATGNPTGAAPSPSPDSVKEVDPKDSRYVQDLRDGHRLLYTIDPVLQDAALTIFRNREVPYASAVVLDLRDNSVLVMAGHSTMDPQVDPIEISTTAWAPAASTFKLVTAASLLENKAATANSKACFHGGLQGLTDDLLKDNAALDTRCETLSSAIAHSHNAVVGKLALQGLDEDQLTRTAHSLQFGVDIPYEFHIEPSPAHVPTDAFARAKVAAGFWHVDLSPMHGALLASVFARGGVYQPPHVIDQVLDPSGQDVTPARPADSRVLARDVAKSVGSMMVGTTNEGTARGSFRDEHGNDYVPGIDVAGKTGSLTGKRDPYLNYNWFVGFAPADEPEIAFAVLLANEKKWRIKAHYAARRLVQIYLQRRDTIREQRSAKLTATALVLPERDPETGAIVAKARPEEPGAAPNREGKNAGAGTTGGASKENSTPLPPVPGPLPQVGQ
jgi:membrane peptidoglycan carboxypeptidase